MGRQQFRRDTITGIYVIVAPDRNDRPGFFPVQQKAVILPDYDSACQFCPGNEHLTPQEEYAFRNGNVWWTRVVKNKFPALETIVNGDSNGEPPKGIFTYRPGHGSHEVIVETNTHNEGLDARPEDLVRELVEMYKERITAYRGNSELQNVLIFKNSGSEAGQSLDHPHSQLIASPIPMPIVLAELKGALEYYATPNFKGQLEQCGYCDMVREELEVKDKHGIDSHANRVIAENPFFASFLPYASRSPMETWIIPKYHQSDFGFLGDQEATHLARMIQEVIKKMNKALPNFHYNLLLHTAPLHSGADRQYHWHLEIIPKGLNKKGGLEEGSGFFLNPLPPEFGARLIHDAN